MAAAQLVARIKGYLKNIGVATDGQLLIGDTGDMPAWKTVTGAITITKAGLTALAAGAVATAAAIADAILTGAKVAVVANANVVGGIPVLFRINIADASADTDVVMTHKVRVLDAWFRSSGIAAHAANDTVQLKNGANAITNAIAKTATVNSLVRAGTIDPTYEEIAAAGTLRVTAVKDTNVAGTMYVLAVRVA